MDTVEIKKLINDIARTLYVQSPSFNRGWDVMEISEKMPYVYKASSIAYDLVEPYAKECVEAERNRCANLVSKALIGVNNRS